MAQAGWAKAKSTPAAPSKPSYDVDHYRAQFEKNVDRRLESTPVRMALVGKENTAKTGLALALSRTPEWFQWAMYASIGASFGIRGIKGFKK